MGCVCWPRGVQTHGQRYWVPQMCVQILVLLDKFVDLFLIYFKKSWKTIQKWRDQTNIGVSILPTLNTILILDPWSWVNKVNFSEENTYFNAHIWHKTFNFRNSRMNHFSILWYIQCFFPQIFEWSEKLNLVVLHDQVGTSDWRISFVNQEMSKLH